MGKNLVASVLSHALLTTYVRVVDTGNISAAARSLFLAQSAVSAQISSITRAIGIPLLERVRGRWEVTTAGKLFYERAQTLLALIDSLEGDITDLAEGMTGHITIASTRTVTDTLLASIVGSFRAQFPEIRVDVLSGNRDAAQRALASDEAEVALVALPFGGKGLTATPFALDHLLLVVPRSHRLASQSSVAFSEILDEQFVLFEEGAGTRGLLEERLGRSFSDLDLQLSLNSNDALIAAVEEGLGLTFLPERSARVWERLGSVHALAISDLKLERELAVVTRSNVTHSKSAAAFLTFMQSYVVPR